MQIPKNDPRVAISPKKDVAPNPKLPINKINELETKLTSAPKPPTISSNILETDFLLCIFNYLTIIHYICFHKSTIAESFTAFPSTIFIL